MPDDQTEKLVKLLEELRDLTKERNAKFEAYATWARQRHEESEKRQKAWMARIAGQRRKFLWTLLPLLLVAIGILCYIGFVVIPKSGQTETEQWLEQMQRMQTNQVPAGR